MVVSKLRQLIRKHLPEGYEEAMTWGMITYQVPQKRYQETYNGQPLCYASLAAQKNHFALYLMNVYSDPVLERRLRGARRKAGKKLDMGKSCVRFRSLEDLPLDAIADTIASTPIGRFISGYEKSRRGAVLRRSR